MLWFVTSVAFVVTVLVLMALVYAFSPGGREVAQRLSRWMEVPQKVQEETFSDKQMDRARGALASLGKLGPAPSGRQATRTQTMLARAGYRGPDAPWAVRGAKLLFCGGLLAIVWFTGVYRYNPPAILLLAAVFGFMSPEIWVLLRVQARQKRLRKSLPDALDLLVICVEVGLGLDQALVKVAEQLQIVHPELSGELRLVNLEMRVGKSRAEALRALATRTGLDDIKSLVAMLIQADRFGTSVAQSLRVFSDELRTKRRQRAEEASSKTTAKMVFPLVFFIFPALMVTILGPAVIILVRVFLPSLGK
jgi:tight adherence protein C